LKAQISTVCCVLKKLQTSSDETCYNDLIASKCDMEYDTNNM